MRRTQLAVCLMIVFFSACAARGEPRARELDGVGGGAYASSEACGDPEPEQPQVASSSCLFGEVFSDIRTNDALLITSETWIRSADALTNLEAEQLLAAVQQSSHTDVTTAAEALARVDQGEVRRMEFYELASERWFVVYEYGVGDNSYGGFFEQEGTEVAASIHDGDLLNCSVVGAEPTTALDLLAELAGAGANLSCS
jgi:hypothetical protein